MKSSSLLVRKLKERRRKPNADSKCNIGATVELTSYLLPFLHGT